MDSNAGLWIVGGVVAYLLTGATLLRHKRPKFFVDPDWFASSLALVIWPIFYIAIVYFDRVNAKAALPRREETHE